MKTTDKPFAEIFKDSLFKAFGFLISEYKFSFVEDPETVWTGRNDFCEVTISWDRPLYICLSIKPPFHVRPSLDIQQIEQYYDSAVKFKDTIEVDQIETEMIRMSTLLKKYCEPMLRGNFSEWKKIRDHYDTLQKP